MFCLRGCCREKFISNRRKSHNDDNVLYSVPLSAKGCVGDRLIELVVNSSLKEKLDLAGDNFRYKCKIFNITIRCAKSFNLECKK